jgi:hypothetical protein
LNPGFEHDMELFYRLSHVLCPTDHTLLIHSSLDRYFILTIVDNAAMISRILISILLGIYPEVRLMDHMVILFLITCRASILSSTVATPFCIFITSTQGGSNFYIFSSIFIILS